MKKKNEKRKEGWLVFYSRVREKKSEFLEGVSFVQKQRGRREKCDFSHSHFH